MRKTFTKINKFFQLTKTGLFVIFFLLVGKSSFCQYPDTVITVSNDIDVITIKNFAAGFLPPGFNIERDYDQNILSKQPAKTSPVRANNVSKKIVSRFSIINNGDKPDSLYFFPGLFFRNVLLYKIENNKATLLPLIAPQVGDSISFRLINILPHDTITVLAESYPSRTYTNLFKPRLISPGYLETFFVNAHLIKKDVTVFTYIFCGLLIMMILFSLANFLQG